MSRSALLMVAAMWSIGCGSTLAPQKESSGGGGKEAGSGSGGGVLALPDPGVRLSQGEPSCVLHGGAVTCYRQPVGVPTSGSGPWDIAGITDAIEVTSSIEQACARTMSGKVLCWGWSHHSQLGLAVPPGQTAITPVELPGLTLIRLATGHHALCGIEVSRRAVCWGGAYAGPLGDDTTIETQTPVPVDGASATADVAMSGETACAALEDGRVICWLDHSEPYVMSGVEDAVAVAVAGQTDGCAIRKDRTVACWAGVAAPVPGLGGVAQITGSLWSNHLAARTEDGRIVVIDADVQPAKTTEALAIHDAVDVSAGYTGVCGVHAADGSISCWDSDGIEIAFPLPN
jgi:hypothetical protein